VGAGQPAGYRQGLSLSVSFAVCIESIGTSKGGPQAGRRVSGWRVLMGRWTAPSHQSDRGQIGSREAFGLQPFAVLEGADEATASSTTKNHLRRI
jgi:hypothetical protein